MGLMDEKMDKILELFFEFPNQRFTVREIARITKIPKSTVQNCLIKLKSERLVNGHNQASNTRFYKIKKINYFIEKIYASGLTEHLNKIFAPSCIILFGSFRKGDSVKESDIDVFIETAKKIEPELSEFEKKLKHKVQIFKEADMDKLPSRLFNNVVNGIKLEGYFKIR
jgi:predicted nucleotidyltransferase